MVFLQLVLALLIVVVCSFAPGFFVVRRLRWSALEKFCGAIGLSLVLLWLVLWALYVAAPGAWTAGSAAVSLTCAVLGVLSWRDARKLFGCARVRLVAASFGLLFLWALVILATIRHYSGAGWGGDWLEHFQRTLVYLHHLPPSTEIFGGFQVPSRPPLAHIIAGFVLAQVGDRYEIFQVVFVFLNLLLFLPCCLLLPLVARTRRFGVPALACIFAMNPVMMMNGTYTGVKTVTAFFTVTAVASYLRGWKKNDRVRMSLAFAMAAGGSLAHYSGLPYALFLGLHYLIAVFPHREQRGKELTSIVAAGAIPLVAWFGWCTAWFGAAGTFTAVAKASVVYGKIYEGGFFAKFFLNLIDAIVPHVLRDSTLVQAWAQPNVYGFIRDNTFLIYQTSLIFTLGVIGGPLLYWLLVRALRRHRGAERNFWLALVLLSIAANFASAGERDYFGVSHLTLITMMAIGLTFLAANFTSRRWIALLIAAGCAFDFSIGVFLQTRIEHLENTPERTVFSGLVVGNGGIDIGTPGPDSLSARAWDNWYRKHQLAYSEKWLRDLNAFRPNDSALEPTKAAIRPALEKAIAEDQKMFGGWYRNHGGEIEFFGDHFGSGDATSAVLVLAAIGMLWVMVGQAGSMGRVASAPVRPPVKPARKAERRASKR